MGIKIFSPGGIDQKSSNINRKPEKLRYSENIQLNEFGEYTKRPGSAVDTDFATESYKNVSFIRSLGEHFYRNGSDYISYKGAVRRVIYKWLEPTTVPTSSMSVAEYLNTAVFTHQEGQIATCVYDGNTVYRAGLPTPMTTATIGTGGYVLTFFEHIDAKGNILFGPATINPCPDTGSISLTFNTLKDTGFSAPYLRLTITSTPTVKDSTSTTLTYDSISPDIAVGSKVVIRNRGTAITITDTVTPSRSFGDAYVILEVQALDTGLKTITFTAASFGTKRISLAIVGSPVIANIHGGVVLRVFFSNSDKTTGYTSYPQSSLNGVLVDNSATSGIISASFVVGLDGALSSIYDITNDKLRPPSCKYVYTYGYQLAYGGVRSFWDFENKETLYTGNDDLVMYSDINNGDLGVNLSAANRILIGDTFDGSITGIAKVKGSLIVFKDRSVYAIDGMLVPGQYSLRQIETNDIGCVSDKSIVSSDEAVLFQSTDGIYAINGYVCKLFSADLDVFFRSRVIGKTVISPALTRGVLWNKGKKLLFFCDNGTAVYDYEFGQWFLWKAISAIEGVTVDNSGVMRMFRTSNVFKADESKADSGSLIDAFIDTAWFDMMEPSILKKMTDIRLFSMNNEGQDLELRYFMDWTENRTRPAPLNPTLPELAADEAGYPVNFLDSGTKTVLRKLDITQAQSISFRIRNRVLNQDLNLTGFEVVGDITQSRDKNVK